MKVIRKKRFLKSYRKLSRRNQERVKQTLYKFSENPFAKHLRNHALQGVLFGVRSINVTGDLRILFKELSDGTYELIELIDVGTHSELYG